MNIYIALFLNFLPFILCFLAVKFCVKASLKTELLASLFGLLAVLPITFIQFYLMSLVPEDLRSNQTDLAGLFCKVLVLNGLLEEGIKTVFLCFIPKKKLELKAFFAAAVLSGLCLGCFESMVYFLQHLNSANMKGGELIYRLIFIRMFSSDLIHALCAGLCGLFVWSRKVKKTNLMPLIFAILAHGIFDYFVYFNEWIHWFAVAAVLFALMECRVHYEKLSESGVVVESDDKKVTKTVSRKKAETNSDKTVVTSAAKVVKKEGTKSSTRSTTKSSTGNGTKNSTKTSTKSDEKKTASSTKTRTRKVKPAAEEEVLEPEVTPELND